jgi:hypothetical protein
MPVTTKTAPAIKIIYPLCSINRFPWKLWLINCYAITYL